MLEERARADNRADKPSEKTEPEMSPFAQPSRIPSPGAHGKRRTSRQAPTHDVAPSFDLDGRTWVALPFPVAVI